MKDFNNLINDELEIMDKCPELNELLLFTQERRNPISLNSLFNLSKEERIEIVADHVKLIHKDLKSNKGKFLSQGQIQRLENTPRSIRLENYGHTSIRNQYDKLGWDSAGLERYIFYRHRLQKKTCYMAADLVKYTKIPHKKGAVYALGVHSADDENENFLIFLTGHLLDRLMERKGLDRNRQESLGEVLSEISQGLLFRNLGEGEIIVYSNDGIMVGNGYTMLKQGQGAVVEFLDGVPPGIEGEISHYILLKTYVTNDMAKPDQIAEAEFATRVNFDLTCSKDFDQEVYESLVQRMRLR